LLVPAGDVVLRQSSYPACRRYDAARWAAPAPNQASGAFVVHILTAADRALAERFSEVRPPIRAPFERLQVAESPWGPVLGGRR
jgi:hypothetical protein